jgi:hypothetical protein
MSLVKPCVFDPKRRCGACNGVLLLACRGGSETGPGASLSEYREFRPRLGPVARLAGYR